MISTPQYLRSFSGDILVRCPKCSSQAHLLEFKHEDAVCRGSRFVCGSCGRSVDWNQDSGRAIPQLNQGAHLTEFDLDLWLTTTCCGESLWVWNRGHLEFLEDYISAKLRPRSRHPAFGWSNSSLQSRLPGWMLQRQNREAVMAGLQRLREKLS